MIEKFKPTVKEVDHDLPFTDEFLFRLLVEKNPEDDVSQEDVLGQVSTENNEIFEKFKLLFLKQEKYQKYQQLHRLAYEAWFDPISMKVMTGLQRLAFLGLNGFPMKFLRRQAFDLKYAARDIGRESFLDLIQNGSKEEVISVSEQFHIALDVFLDQFRKVALPSSESE